MSGTRTATLRSHRVLDRSLKRLVVPMEDGTAPLEVMLDTMAEVNRLDAGQAQDVPLTAQDFSSCLGPCATSSPTRRAA